MRAILTAALALIGPTALADTLCSVHSGAQRTSLIELYTSEGCNSCPPADRWLAALPSDPNWIALAFHVDYWDQLGWKDRFGSPDNSQRQRLSAQKRGSRRVYTPQVLADGLEHVRWYSQPLPRRDQVDSPVMTLSLRSWASGQAELDVLGEGDLVANALVHAAIVETDLSTDVRRGENAGRTLQHAHVVRSWKQADGAERVRLSLPIPDDLAVDQSSLVAWMETRNTAEPLQALRLPLDSCRIR